MNSTNLTPAIGQPTPEEIGASMIVSQPRVISHMRTVYFVPNNFGNFDIVHHHRRLLQALQTAASELEIIPNDANVPAYATLSSLPTNEAQFRDQFEVLIEYRDDGNKITVCHAVRLRSTLQEIKFKQQNDFLNYLKANKITVIQDKFSRQRIASVGLFIGVHPDMVHRRLLAEFILNIIKSKVNLRQRILHELHPEFQSTQSDPNEFTYDVEIPAFELIVSNVNYGIEEERISTRAIDLLVATPFARLLKAILSEIDFQEWLQQGRFIGRGYMHMTSPEKYRAVLNLQNNFVNDTICFAISGLSDLANRTFVQCNNQQMLLKDILLTDPSIINMYPTALVQEQGKWLILTTKKDYRRAVDFFDKTIPGFFAELPATAGMKIPGYNIASRTMTENVVGKTLFRANQVAQTIPQVVTFTREARPKRSQPVLTFHGSESVSGNPASKKHATDSVTGTAMTADETTLRKEFQEMLDNRIQEVRTEVRDSILASEQRITTSLQQTIKTTLQTSIEKVVAVTFDTKLNATNKEVEQNKTEVANLKTDIERCLFLLEEQRKHNSKAMDSSAGPTQSTITPAMGQITNTPPRPQLTGHVMHSSTTPWYPPNAVPFPHQFGPQQQEFDPNYNSMMFQQQMYTSPNRADFQSGLDPGYMHHPSPHQL